MELPFFDNVAVLCSSSSLFLISSVVPVRLPSKQDRRVFDSHFYVKSKKKVNMETLEGIQRESKVKLSHILRTEAAVRAVEGKANSTKATRLWPKAVLEALEESMRNNRWESAIKIFGLLRKQHWYQPRCQTYTKLLMMLGKCRQPGEAGMLFEQMLAEGIKPTIDVYTALVCAYGFSGLFDEAFSAIDVMKSVSNCKPDVYTYSILINCCAKFRRFDLIDRVVAEMSYLGINHNTVTYNTIIDGYGKAEMFELMENSLSGLIETARCLPDVFTLNSFLWAYGNVGKIDKMEKWYDEFQHMGITPDIKTFNILIRSYGKAGMYDKMGSIMEYMEKRFFSPTIVTYNTVIEIFGKAGNIEKMECFFRTMKYKGLKPNSITYCSLVSAYGQVGHLEKVCSIMRQIQNSDVVLDTPFFNCVINAYGQAGDLKKMEHMFLEMKAWKCKPDHVTFATMAQGYDAQGIVKSTQELKRTMLLSKDNIGACSSMVNTKYKLLRK